MQVNCTLKKECNSVGVLKTYKHILYSFNYLSLKNWRGLDFRIQYTTLQTIYLLVQPLFPPPLRFREGFFRFVSLFLRPTTISYLVAPEGCVVLFLLLLSLSVHVPRHAHSPLSSQSREDKEELEFCFHWSCDDSILHNYLYN